MLLILTSNNKIDYQILPWLLSVHLISTNNTEIIKEKYADNFSSQHITSVHLWLWKLEKSTCNQHHQPSRPLLRGLTSNSWWWWHHRHETVVQPQQRLGRQKGRAAEDFPGWTSNLGSNGHQCFLGMLRMDQSLEVEAVEQYQS